MSNEADISIAVAIDPMALILSTKWYLIYVEIHHPNIPVIETLAKVFAQMAPAERHATVQRAKTLASYSQATVEVAAHATQ